MNPTLTRTILRGKVPRRITQQTRSFSEAPAENEKGDRLTNILMRAIDTYPRPRPQFSPEEAAKNNSIGKQYVIGKFQVHNAIHHDLACKIRLKEHAIRMMPRGYLREQALEVDGSDESMPPLFRSIPLDTPPIEGFDPTLFMNED